jgi:SAM-dependent methyltransferase
MKTVRDDSQLRYSGTDNLEVMADAVNYNGFLVDLVASRTTASQKILDFGAGVGTFAVRLRALGRDVACVEPDAAQAARIAALGMDVYGDASQIDDDSFGFVYSFNVLEHIDDDVGALRVLYRKLAPGGRLLVYVPAFDSLYSSMDAKVGHVRRYRRTDLADKVTAAGFVVRSSEYVDCLGFLAALAYKYAGPKDGSLNPNGVRLFDRFVFPISRTLDHLLGRVFGKNLLLIADRAESRGSSIETP